MDRGVRTTHRITSATAVERREQRTTGKCMWDLCAFIRLLSKYLADGLEPCRSNRDVGAKTSALTGPSSLQSANPKKAHHSIPANPAIRTIAAIFKVVCYDLG